MSTIGIRVVLRGALDGAFVLLNTGFLPIEGSQAESHAILGSTCPRVACVPTCPAGPMTCTVTAGSLVGTCTGICGICYHVQLCPGTKPKISDPNATLPCTCSSGC